MEDKLEITVTVTGVNIEVRARGTGKIPDKYHLINILKEAIRVVRKTK